MILAHAVRGPACTERVLFFSIVNQTVVLETLSGLQRQWAAGAKQLARQTRDKMLLAGNYLYHNGLFAF